MPANKPFQHHFNGFKMPFGRCPATFFRATALLPALRAVSRSSSRS